MAQLYILAAAALVGLATGAVPNDCCKEKTVGDKTYYLAGMEDTSMYNCLASCVYKLVDDDEGKMFCFAAGDLEVVCGDGGEFTEKPGGNEEPSPEETPEEPSPEETPEEPSPEETPEEPSSEETPTAGGNSSSCSYPDTHTMVLYPGPAEQCGYELIFKGLDEAGKELILARHNELRQKVASGNEAGQPGASNMKKLVWNDELADIAQRWADQCQFGHDAMRDMCDGTWVGQNAYFGQTSDDYYMDDVMLAIGDAVDAWYNEVTDPGFSSADINPFNFGEGWGHYTQVAWADTAELGCGMVYYETDDSWYSTLVICNYAVAGNLVGSPMYLAGPGCANCPAGTACDATYGALCA